MPELSIIQLIVKTFVDKGGNERTVNFFRRHGAWWEVIDTEVRHPEEKRGIDLREDAEHPNFKRASPKDAKELDSEFFPTGWERAWQDVVESEREKLQILLVICLAAAGVDPDHLKLVKEIRDELVKGRTLKEVWEARKLQILKLVLVSLASALVAAVVLRFLRRLFRRFWPKELTRKVEGADTIELEVKPEFTQGKRSIRGNLFGEVDGDVLRVDSRTMENWVNQTGQRGLVRELAEDWFQELADFGRRRGLRQVVITQVASSPSGVKGLASLGFTPVPGRILEGGLGQWRRVIDLD